MKWRVLPILIVLAVLASTTLACQPKIVEVTRIVEATTVVEKQVEVTKIVEKVVEKIVKETVVVEKEKVVEKVVTATPLPSPLPTEVPTLTPTSWSVYYGRNLYEVRVYVTGLPSDRVRCLHFDFFNKEGKKLISYTGPFVWEDPDTFRSSCQVWDEAPVVMKAVGTAEECPWVTHSLLGGKNPVPLLSPFSPGEFSGEWVTTIEIVFAEKLSPKKPDCGGRPCPWD